MGYGSTVFKVISLVPAAVLLLSIWVLGVLQGIDRTIPLLALLVLVVVTLFSLTVLVVTGENALVLNLGNELYSEALILTGALLLAYGSGYLTGWSTRIRFEDIMGKPVTGGAGESKESGEKVRERKVKREPLI